MFQNSVKLTFCLFLLSNAENLPNSSILEKVLEDSNNLDSSPDDKILHIEIKKEVAESTNAFVELLANLSHQIGILEKKIQIQYPLPSDSSSIISTTESNILQRNAQTEEIPISKPFLYLLEENFTKSSNFWEFWTKYQPPVQIYNLSPNGGLKLKLEPNLNPLGYLQCPYNTFQISRNLTKFSMNSSKLILQFSVSSTNEKKTLANIFSQPEFEMVFSDCSGSEIITWKMYMYMERLSICVKNAKSRIFEVRQLVKGLWGQNFHLFTLALDPTEGIGNLGINDRLIENWVFPPFTGSSSPEENFEICSISIKFKNMDEGKYEFGHFLMTNYELLAEKRRRGILETIKNAGGNVNTQVNDRNDAVPESPLILKKRDQVFDDSHGFRKIFRNFTKDFMNVTFSFLMGKV